MMMMKEKKEGERRGNRTSVNKGSPTIHLVIRSVKRVSEIVLFAFFLFFFFVCGGRS